MLLDNRRAVLGRRSRVHHLYQGENNTLLLRRDLFLFEDPLMLLPRLLIRLYSTWARRTYPFAAIGHDVEIHPSLNLPKYLAHRVKLGNSVRIDKDVELGVSCPHRLEAGEPVIVIDDGCVIARRSQISARNGVHLEPDVILSASVLIMDHGHSYEDIAVPIKKQGITDGGRIRIGRGCWIGHAAAIICEKGELILGCNSVVGANAVVTRSVPPYSVVSGNPARVVKHFDPAKGLWALGSSRSTGSDCAIDDRLPHFPVVGTSGR